MNLISLCSTAVSFPKFLLWGQITAVNVCSGNVACTLTTRYEYMSKNDFLSLAHFPKTVVLCEYDM